MRKSRWPFSEPQESVCGLQTPGCLSSPEAGTGIRDEEDSVTLAAESRGWRPGWAPGVSQVASVRGGDGQGQPTGLRVDIRQHFPACCSETSGR